MIVNGKRIEGLQAYKAKGLNEYAYVWRDEEMGLFVEPAYGDLPSCHCGFEWDWLQETHYPVSFAKLPENIQQHLVSYLKNVEEL